MKYLTKIFFYLLYIFNLLYNQATIREKAMLIEMLEQMQIFSWRILFRKQNNSIYQPACCFREWNIRFWKQKAGRSCRVASEFVDVYQFREVSSISFHFRKTVSSRRYDSAKYVSLLNALSRQCNTDRTTLSRRILDREINHASAPNPNVS